MNIYPVIHYLDRATSLEQVNVARNCGANGVFLISHHGNDDDLIAVAGEAKRLHPDYRIGINLLSKSPLYACNKAIDQHLDMVWADDMGVDSSGSNAMAESLSRFAHDFPTIQLFASVAFKYRPHEPNPSLAAKMARHLGFIPTTSGTATGSAPGVPKIIDMSAATECQLAVASGMTPENIGNYAPYLSHILVATGVGLDEYRIDPQRLMLLIANSKVPRVDAAMTSDEVRAALRFLETCDDGEGYDVPKPMMKRLSDLGLVTHEGGGHYETTPLLFRLQAQFTAASGT